MYTQINGQNIYYQKTGKGKPLIMLHGWGTDVSNFWPIVDFLKKDFTLWLIDLPGFGKSELPNLPAGRQESFSVSDYAKTIAQFIGKNHIGKPAILGHSFGGRVSIKLAGLYPSLINKLILIGSSGIKQEKTLFQILIFPFAKLGNLFMPDIFHLRSRTRQKLYKKLESDYADAGAMKDIFMNTLKEDQITDLPKIGAETLLIWGEEDKAVPLKYGKRMYRLIKNSKLVVMEGERHFPHVTNPKGVASYVKDFV